MDCITYRPIVKWVKHAIVHCKISLLLYQTSHYCGKFLHKKFSHTTAVPIIPLQEDLIKYPHNKSGYKADFIRSYKQLINEMS